MDIENGEVNLRRIQEIPFPMLTLLLAYIVFMSCD